VYRLWPSCRFRSHSYAHAVQQCCCNVRVIICTVIILLLFTRHCCKRIPDSNIRRVKKKKKRYIDAPDGDGSGGDEYVYSWKSARHEIKNEIVIPSQRSITHWTRVVFFFIIITIITIIIFVIYFSTTISLPERCWLITTGTENRRCIVCPRARSPVRWRFEPCATLIGPE
jgi:hypothetical protein